MSDALVLWIGFFAARHRRWEYAIVDGAGFSHQTGPLELGLCNKSNDFAHFGTKSEFWNKWL